METKDLKKWRFWIPGLIAFASFLALLKSEGRSLATVQLSPTQFTWFVPFIVSVLYQVFDIRDRVDRKLFAETRLNIETRLFRLRDAEIVPESAFGDIQAKDGLMDIFYQYVDNEKTLKERSIGIMQNGVIVSSMLDAFVILVIVGAAGVAYSYCEQWPCPAPRWITAEVSGGIAALGLIAKWPLLPISQKNHIGMSNDQLDFIEGRLGNDVADKIFELWAKLHQA